MASTDDKARSDLLAALKAREQSAYTSFVRKWAPRLERDLARRGFDPVDAYDLSFDCATHVLSKLDSYLRDASGFDAWVIVVARNYAKDWRRKNKRLLIVALSSDNIAKRDTVSEDDSEEHSPWIAEGLVALNDALATVSPDDRTLLRLRYRNPPASFKEIAGVLSIENNAARTRLHRILKRLKNLLTKDVRMKKLV